ncbi:MAG: YhdP family protein, partial [Syntrophales bacterium]
PLITAEMSSSPVPLEKFGPLIPYGIVSKGVADFIKTHIKGGVYQLKEGSLNGRLSQIAHMDENENYNVLHVKVGVDEGLFSWGKNVPIVSGIKGELELRGKDFLLHNMSAKFGESPMTLEGRITDYCLATPSSYPFNMTMTPGQKEIAWLLAVDSKSKFAFTGKSSLQMTGSGSTNNYTLDGRWDLTDASYSYSDIFTKPQSQGNRLIFKSNFKTDKVQVESFSYQLASLTVNATGLYRIKDKYVSAFAVNSNPFQIEELSINLPRMREYEPSGRIGLALTCSGMPRSIADLGWRGSITFSDVSFKPTETVKAISALSGSVSLRKNGLDTSLLVGRIGGSLIQGRAMLKDFNNPSVSVNVSSALLDLQDLGLQNPSGAVKLKDFAWNIIFRDKGLQIKRLSARMNDSFFNVTGTMPDVKKPFFDIRVTSSYLDMDDIILLSRTNVPKKKKSEGLSLKASVQSDKGKINRIPYSGLRTTLTYLQRTMDISAFEMKAFNGGFSGTGHIVFTPGGVMQCQAGFTIAKMSAEQILKYAGSETMPITGTLTMKGDVTAEGATISDLKKTAQGTATLFMEEGSLRRFPVLSKIFSILNVSQLLSFELPDMITDGMPYTSIKGTFSLKDGILTSNDLFVNSNAMNMSLLGKADIIREELDTIIGIKPFQTVDKVVSKIPIVGWILTDDTNSLITVYFKAQGKWSDPTVYAIPVRSMEKGVLDIFKRVFQLPEKLITDTGEVIMGR